MISDSVYMKILIEVSKHALYNPPRISLGIDTGAVGPAKDTNGRTDNSLLNNEQALTGDDRHEQTETMRTDTLPEMDHRHWRSPPSPAPAS